MDESNVILREYKDSDYSACENLVSNAWEFDKNFPPNEMANLGKYLYTMGSISGSNFRMVVEVRNKVVAFLFGFNEKIPLAKHDLHKLSSKLAILKRLLFIKGIKYKEKTGFLKAISAHEVNRAELVDRGKSEIILFVVDPAYQGSGFGKRLFAEFKSNCKKSNIESIIVETNRLGASSFYEHIGFKHIGNFNSPLHQYVEKDGQACMYEYFL